MSEQRRSTLTPFGNSDKKSNKSLRKSFRLSFTLSDPNEDSCPVFDYGTVVKSEERRTLKKLRQEKEKKPNGVVDAFNDNEDEDVRRLAEKFEEKYGGSNWKSYAELGAGYDETDPFIDNTEANDEALQEDQETPCGGYYINSGPLELKRVEVSDHSDTDEITKRRPKRGLSVIEEDDCEEENEEEEEIADSETKSVTEEIPQEIKKLKISNEKEEPEERPATYNHEVEEPLKKKKKRFLSDDVTAEGTTIKVKKAKTVKVLLEEKRVQESSVGDDSKKLVASSTSISEAIESVINASNNDENSNCSNSSHSAIASTTASDDSQEARPSSQIIPSPLPENLSPELLSLVDQIRRTAAVTDNTRKTFCTDINNALVKLEWKSREFSATNRNLLFSHLACYLPCTKDTLMRRAKKLFIHKEESQMDTIICKLKATIDATMPSLVEEYEKECKKIAEEKSITGTPSNGTASMGEEQHSPESTKLPKRKFPWTEETRGYLREIVRLKNRCYKVLKPRKNTNEEYVTTFIHNKIRSLWPSGWMKTSALLRESSRSPHAGKSRHSSSRSPSKSDLSRLNISLSYPSPNNAPSSSLYGSQSVDTSHQPVKSPSTPHAAKNGADPINLLTKIATSLNTSPKKSFSPGLHQNSKTEKPESFSMDCLLKRTSDNTTCNDYNTTLSDLMKKDSIIMNGASLPLKNVNSSQLNDSGRSEKILDLSSCNSSVSGTQSVNQSISNNDRTSMRASDSVSLSVNTSDSIIRHTNTPSPCRKEVNQNVLLNRKQRLLQQNTQSNWHSQGNCDNMINKKTDIGSEWPHSAQKSPVAEDNKPPAVMKNVERRMSEETTTATDILSQLISESLLAPSQPASTTTLYNTKVLDERKSTTPPTKGQELLFDVMQDLKELNHMSSGGSLDSKQDKKNSFTGASWSYSKPTEPSFPKPSDPSTPYHKEFLKHLFKNRDTATSASSTLPYSRHNVSPYENSQYMNEISKSVYSSTPHRSAQAISSHADSHAGKVSQMNQGCIMKSLPNISSGHPHRYMTQMDYSTDDQHLLGLSSSLQYGLPGWYTGSESQSHQ